MTKPEQPAAAMVEVDEANERLSQTMLDNTSCEVEEVGDGLLASRTMVLCAYDDLRIILGFVDKARAAPPPMIDEARAKMVERLRFAARGTPMSWDKRLYKEAADMLALPVVRGLDAVIQKWERGQNHDEGAFDPDCEICLILADLRALAPPPASEEA